MYKKIIWWLIISMTVCLLTADELDDKMMQLRQIEKQIDLIQQKAKQSEQKKQKAQSDISQAQKSKKKIEQQITALQQKEKVAQDSLAAISERVNYTQDRLHNLKVLSNNEFMRLFYIDMQDSYVYQETKDKYLLSMLISATVQRFADLSGLHQSLVMTEEERRHEFAMLHSNRMTQEKQSQQVAKKIQNLTKQTQQLDKEKAEYDKQVSQLRKDASELESLVARLSASSGKKVSNYQFTTKRIPWPVRGKIIRDFGEEARSNNTSVINNGLDIAVPEGTSVQAVDDGEVVFSDRYGGQGKLIIIDHKNGFFSVYAFNRDLLVSKGAKVKKGQTIAKSGATGSAIEPSLHFELRKDGRAVNPMNYLE